MQRLRIEVLIPSEASDDELATRVHELMTRQGWVYRGCEVERVPWTEGLEMLRETLGIKATVTAAQEGEIRNSFSPVVEVVEDGEVVQIVSSRHTIH